MSTDESTSDCVEMKRRAQEELLAEYESRKNEFPTFADFLHAVADESQWIRSIRAKVGHPTPQA